MSASNGPGSLAVPPSAAAETFDWQRLAVLGDQLEANCAALATREPTLAATLRSHVPTGEFVITVQGDRVIIAKLEGQTAHVRPCLLSPVAAHETLLKVYPGGSCTEPILIAGVDQGWLWEQLYHMPVATPATPGHRPPLYFLVRDVEDLWLALHLHDWRTMLADDRVRLMVGADVTQQFDRSLAANPQIPPPRVALTLGPALWPAGADLGSIVSAARAPLEQELGWSLGLYDQIYGGATPEGMAQRLRDGRRRLRVLGITSRYTTFLQYSMRDWLAGFESLGHDTKLLIESGAHEQHTSLCFARACTEFQPDLVVMIDHYRAEYGRILPEQVPCVMWVQDRLPNIFSDKAGAAQGPNDFCAGFGRLHLSGRHGYPASRYLSSTIGVNEERFDRSPPTTEQLERYRCDVSYVSHASTPADVLLQEKLDQQNELGRRVLKDIFDRLVAHYQAGGESPSDVLLRQMIEASMRLQKTTMPEDDLKALIVFFNQRINNALFRHQTLQWLAGLGVDLRIYGRGWESHPKLAKYARGVADNITDLGAIYRASKINIQVTPHGAVHQRLLDGLAAGGFFLCRWHPGDFVGRIYQELAAWTDRHGIRSDEELYARADERVANMIAQINRLEGSPPDRREMRVFDVMNGHRDTDFMTSADSIWPTYEEIAFDTRGELEQKVHRFLTNDAARVQIAASMRQAVVDRASYTGISRRLLGFIADSLSPAARAVAA